MYQHFIYKYFWSYFSYHLYDSIEIHNQLESTSRSTKELAIVIILQLFKDHK